MPLRRRGPPGRAGRGAGRGDRARRPCAPSRARLRRSGARPGPCGARGTGSARTRSMAWASASGRSGGTTNPRCPSRTSSALPPASVTTMGRPAAIPSMTALERPSCREQSTPKVPRARSAGTSLRLPRKCTAPARPSSFASCSRWQARPPSPTRKARTSGTPRRTCANAARKSSWRFTSWRMLATSTATGAVPVSGSGPCSGPAIMASKCARSSPLRMTTTLSAATRSRWTTRSRTASQFAMTAPAPYEAATKARWRAGPCQCTRSSRLITTGTPASRAAGTASRAA